MAKAQSPLLHILLVTAILQAVIDRACAILPVRVSPEPNFTERAGLFEMAHDGSVLFQFGQGPRDVNSVWRSVVGDSPQLLSGALGQTRNVRPAGSLSLAPDGQHALLWVAPEEDANSISLQLFRVPVGGGEPTPVEQDATAAGSRPLWSYEAYGFTPDGSELLYLADHEQPSVFDLYAQPAAGGPTRRLSPPRTSNASLYIANFLRIAPNGQRIVYPAGFSGAWFTELYSAKLDGSGAVPLNVGLPIVHYLENEPFDSTDTGIVFGTNAGLYRNEITGGTPQLLSQPFRVTDFLLTQNGTWAGYLLGADLYGVSTAGGDIVQYTDDGAAGHYYIERFFTTDGSRFIFADVAGDRDRLLSAPIAGGTAVDLTAGQPSGSNTDFNYLARSVDEDRVVYQTFPDIGINRPRQVYSVRPDGTDSVTLNMPLGPTNAVETDTVLLTPDRQFVLIGVIEQARHNFEEAAWYVTPTEGGPLVRLTPELPTFASISQFKATPDGSLFYYTADDRLDEVDELYRVAMPMARVAAGSGAAGEVGGGRVAGGVSYRFDEVIAPGVFVSETSAVDAAGPSALPDLCSLTGNCLLWNLSYTGEFTGEVELTLQYLDPWSASGNGMGASVYRETSPGLWQLVDDFEALATGAVRLRTAALTRLVVARTVPEPSATFSLIAAAAILGLRRTRAE